MPSPIKRKDDHKTARARAESDLAQRGVTLRAIFMGLVLMPINVYWVTVVEVRWYSLDGSCLPLFITPVFMLFTLALVNLILVKY